MSEEQPESVTRVLRVVGDGDPEAARELLPLVYEELRSLARPVETRGTGADVAAGGTRARGVPAAGWQ